MSNESGCTCCDTHGQGAHRVQLSPPAAPPDPPELVKAAKARDAAAERERVARARWAEAEVARRTYEVGLQGRYSSTLDGIAQATREEREHLEELGQTAAKLNAVAREVAIVAAEARHVHAAAQHRATQQMIQAW